MLGALAERTGAGFGASLSGLNQWFFGPPNSTVGIKGGGDGWMGALSGPSGYSLTGALSQGRQRGGLAGMWSPLKNYFGIGYRSGGGASVQVGQRGFLSTLRGGEEAWAAASNYTKYRRSGLPGTSNFNRAAGINPSAGLRGAATNYGEAFKGLKASSTFRRRQVTGAVGVGLGAVGIGATVGWGNVASVGAYGLAGGAAGMLAGSVLGGPRGWGRGMGKAGAFGGAAYGAFRAMGVF